MQRYFFQRIPTYSKDYMLRILQCEHKCMSYTRTDHMSYNSHNGLFLQCAL